MCRSPDFMFSTAMPAISCAVTVLIVGVVVLSPWTPNTSTSKFAIKY